MASAVYGAFIGLAFLVFTRLVPQPVGSVLFWGVVSLQLSWFAITCWRRTGLPFVTAAGVTGAAVAMSFLVLGVFGHPFPGVGPEAWVPLAGVLVLGPLFLFIESRVNRAKWKQWAEHMAQRSAWDIVTGRHIPQLRDGGA